MNQAQIAQQLRNMSDEIEASQARSLVAIRAICGYIEAMSCDAGVTSFSQRDERWAKYKIGTALTIGQAGCLVTAAASILCDAGFSTDPERLCAWLDGHAGFAAGALFVWSAIDALNVVKSSGLVNCPGPAPIERIRETLGRGGFCIAQMDFNPGGAVDQHWVRVLNVDRNNALVMDPWPLPGNGNMTLMCPCYGATPEIAIWKVGFYERSVNVGLAA